MTDKQVRLLSIGRPGLSGPCRAEKLALWCRTCKLADRRVVWTKTSLPLVRIARY